jgi:hypothetical protein
MAHAGKRICRSLALLGVCMNAGLCLAQRQDDAPSFTQQDAATSVNLTVSATGTLVGTSNFVMVGTATISGIGTGIMTAEGSLAPVASGQNTGPLKGPFILVFASGDALVGTFSIPAGILVSFIGGSTSGTGSLEITGGTGQYTGATGSFPSVSGMGGASGATTASVQLSGNGTINVAGGTSGGIRTIAHAADGNSFKTTIILTNTDTAQASYSVQFNDNNGNVQTSRFELEIGALTGTIPPGKAVTIRTAGLGAQTVQGWAELTAPSTVNALVIYSQPDGPRVQEGTATANSAGSTHFFMPFDNSNGAVTGAAITNSGVTAANNVTVTLRYDNGLQETVAWGMPIPPRSHTAFALNNQFAHSAGLSGVAEFSSDQPLSAVVFRFNTSGAFTALGVIPQ